MIGRLPSSDVLGINAAWATGTATGVLGGATRALPEGRASLRVWAEAAGLEGLRTGGSERLDVRTTRACMAAALALDDAGLLTDEALRADTGILACDPDGCVADNRRYFEDYIEGGRVLGRGILFIRTLPTSGACEAAIRLGLMGPTLYLARREGWLPRALEHAAGCVGRAEASAMLVTYGSDAGALAVLIRGPGAAADRPVPSGRFALRTARTDVGALVRELAARGAPVEAPAP